MKTQFNLQLRLLQELQAIDLRLSEIHSKIEIIPEQIAAVESAYLAVKNDCEGSKQALAEAEKAKRHEEMELTAAVDHAKQREAKLYAIKTTKEYQAALKEIAETKKANKEREDRILGLMEQIEALTKKITQLLNELADKEAAYAKEKEKVDAEVKQMEQEKNEYESKRPSILEQLDKKIARQYDYVRQRYTNALMTVNKGVCQGCHMNVHPQLYNEMLRGTEFKHCPSCHRLIYVVKETEQTDTTSEE